MVDVKKKVRDTTYIHVSYYLYTFINLPLLTKEKIISLTGNKLQFHCQGLAN